MILLSNLKRFGQLYIIFALAMLLFVSHSQVQLYKAKFALAQHDVEMQNAAIVQMKVEGDRLAQRIKLAQVEADKIKVDYDKQIKTILSAKVPERCENAIEWGIQQARVF